MFNPNVFKSFELGFRHIFSCNKTCTRQPCIAIYD